MVTKIVTLFKHDEQKSISAHSTLNLEKDGLEQQKSTRGYIPVSHEQEFA